MDDFYIENNLDKNYFGVVEATGMDVRYDDGGLLKTTSGKKRLASCLQKMLITSYTNLIEKRVSYGTYLPALRGQKSDPFFMKAFIADTIADGIDRYQSMQEEILQDQEIPEDELVRQIISIQVQNPINNNTMYMVAVEVETQKQLSVYEYESVSIALSLSDK